MMKETVYIVDDDEVVRRSLSRLVESAHLCTQAFSDAPTFLEQARFDQVACLVVDLKMPGMSGLELLKELEARDIDLPAIVITAFGDIPQAVESLKTGALDFIQKPFNDEVLLGRISEALEKSRQNFTLRAEKERVQQRLKRLTPRETEVMQLLVLGSTSKEVGLQLNISRKTVDIHRSRIMHKLEADSIAQLVRMVMLTEEGPGREPGTNPMEPLSDIP